MRFAPALVLLFLAAGCGPADPGPGVEAAPDTLAAAYFGVEDAYARPASAGGTSALYFRIDNTTDTSDTLLAVRTDASDDVQIHQTLAGSDGQMRMEPVDSLAVPAGRGVVLEPGGLHVMLLDLKRDLAVGDSLLVELDFAGRGTLIPRVPVRSLRDS